MPFAMPESIKLGAPLTKWSLGYQMLLKEDQSWNIAIATERVITASSTGLDRLLESFFEENKAMPVGAAKSKLLGPESPIFKQVRLTEDPLRTLTQIKCEDDVLDFVCRFGIPGPHLFNLTVHQIPESISPSDGIYISVPFVTVSEVLDLARFVEVTLDLAFHPAKVLAGDGSRIPTMKRLRGFGNRHRLPQNPHLAELSDSASVAAWLEEAKTTIEGRLLRLCNVHGTFQSSPLEIRPHCLEGLVLMLLRESILGSGTPRRRCLQCGHFFEAKHRSTKFCPRDRSCKNIYNKAKARKKSI